MKIIRISDELHQKIKILAEKDRRTINAQAEILLETGMGKPFEGGSPTETPPSPKNTEPKTILDIVRPDANDFAMLEATKKITSEATPQVDAEDILRSNMEQPCCQNEMRPCKHWVWDTTTGEGYKNTLSGRLMEVE